MAKNGGERGRPWYADLAMFVNNQSCLCDALAVFIGLCFGTRVVYWEKSCMRGGCY